MSVKLYFFVKQKIIPLQNLNATKNRYTKNGGYLIKFRPSGMFEDYHKCQHSYYCIPNINYY